ncbi:Glycosyl transferases group 1 [Carpediemonas membranifera]|uniref:GDP-Man:Man(3)GlcNAc(2)-PP-Dol alpha-1,2-mannosyltransferase n=1 Tax=Carpediemonas membranifera TaxID=201153 RepID=A0A8J6AW92_9EUKA|nr:Glycosyl transferases group 1 [Carpediemonas membranifera]|eukprot:KAG9396391.1 Glycosyl transferases group 1 [Carpediemonas membranifera]
MSQIRTLICLFFFYLRLLVIDVPFRRFVFKPIPRESGERVIGLFHPNAADGGGGERVLWTIVQYLQRYRPQFSLVLYADTDCSVETLTSDASAHFGLSINASALRLVRITGLDALRPSRYRIFTLLFQLAVGGALARQALASGRPDVFLDTHGIPMAYPVAKMAGSRVGTYTHHPFVSSDMIWLVESRVSQFNNSKVISKSAVLTRVKVFYYKLVTTAYRFCGGAVDVSMANSQWTRAHVKAAWGLDPTVVYPLCTIDDLLDMPLEGRVSGQIVSVGQFRQEKNHELIVRAFASAVNGMTKADLARTSPSLVLVGSVRNDGDKAVLDSVNQLITDLKIETMVSIEANAPYPRVLALLASSQAAVHAMRDEHFGLVVIEAMAAGCLMIAHNSGGPREDIIADSGAGLLAETEAEYAAAMRQVWTDRLDGMRAQGRVRVQTVFTAELFKTGLLGAVDDMVRVCQR